MREGERQRLRVPLPVIDQIRDVIVSRADLASFASSDQPSSGSAPLFTCKTVSSKPSPSLKVAICKGSGGERGKRE